MRLIGMSVFGYRRFDRGEVLKLNSKLVALIGPNESGKTSLLKAITHFGHDDAFDGNELTRGEPTDQGEPVLEWLFHLTENDRKELSQKFGDQKPKWLYISKFQNGRRRVKIEPTPRRRKEPRLRVAKGLERSIRSPVIEELARDNGYSLDDVRLLAQELRRGEDSLSSEVVEKISEAATYLFEPLNDQAPKYLKRLGRQISELYSLEEPPSPAEEIRNYLLDVLPNLVFFDEECRNLLSSYDLQRYHSDPPIALRNLTDVAKLNLTELVAAINSEDQAEVNTLQRRANTYLATAFRKFWGQSSIAVEFRIDGSILHIQIRDTTSRFSDLAERSDGLRQFVALMAFCMHETISNPLLLIDEAETHLHYDAQADIVGMLSRQPIAEQIVYSTHSIGCLPEDLGSGICLIEPNGDNTRSRIKNKFWAEGASGFSPFLFGMGATTLAFFPLKAALLVEGPSDHLLLLRLFKEAARREYIGFQVVPGLAESNREQIKILAAHGSRVAYLTDNDSGGREIHNFLSQKCNVRNELIFTLENGKADAVEIEDFLDPAILVKAVNRYVASKGNPEVSQINVEDIGEYNRNYAIDSWFKARHIKTPSKINLAYSILDIMLENPSLRLLDSRRRDRLKNLLKKIESCLS